MASFSQSSLSWRTHYEAATDGVDLLVGSLFHRDAEPGALEQCEIGGIQLSGIELRGFVVATTTVAPTKPSTEAKYWLRRARGLSSVWTHD